MFTLQVVKGKDTLHTQTKISETVSEIREAIVLVPTPDEDALNECMGEHMCDPQSPHPDFFTALTPG